MENDELLGEGNTDLHQSKHHEDDKDIHSDWESEEVPLSVLQIQQRGVDVIWTINSSNVVDINPFLDRICGQIWYASITLSNRQKIP